MVNIRTFENSMIVIVLCQTSKENLCSLVRTPVNVLHTHTSIFFLVLYLRGVRLTEDIDASWEGLRHFIRDNCPAGTKVFILSGDKSATATLKLRRDRMIPLQTGEQNLRWIQYTIGRKRQTTEQKMELRRTKDGADNDNGGNPDTDTDDRWQQQRRHQPSPTKKSYTPTNKFNTNTNAENKNKSKRSPQGRGNQQQNAGSSLKEDSWV